MYADYQSDFEAYLSCTDEKEILLREIKHDFQLQKVKTVLDIGAGNGQLAIPLSNEFTYLGVEKKPEFVNNLTKNGINVIEGAFPVPIEDKFDAVLISHSLNVYRDNFASFVNAAWACVKPGGCMLIITYNSESGDWNKLIAGVEVTRDNPQKLSFAEIVSSLEKMGTVKTRVVQSHVRSKTIDEMLQALSFVASNGNSKYKSEFYKHKIFLEKKLNANYFSSGEYCFPFNHYFVLTLKQ